MLGTALALWLSVGRVPARLDVPAADGGVTSEAWMSDDPGNQNGSGSGPDLFAALFESHTRAMESEADMVEAAGGMLPLVGLTGPAAAPLAELFDGVAKLSARKLAAARFALEEAARAGQDTTFKELAVRQEAATLRSFGGDPDSVAADHVVAWVLSPESAVVWGFRAVPVAAARFNSEADRWEADLADLDPENI